MSRRIAPADVQTALADPERPRVLDRTGLMDSGPEEGLDRWTGVAAEALGAPVAILALVDDRRQLLESVTGPTGSVAEQQRPGRTRSFCEHVVAGDRVLSVEDARSERELLVDGAIGDDDAVAYAGAPIRVLGETVGALVVLDPEARAWSPADLRLLARLAEGLAHEIELRCGNAELTRTAALTDARNRIHELIADDQSLPRILEAIVRSIETHDPGLCGSILLLDPERSTLHHGAAPSLAASYQTAIEGLAIGPSVGSCGTAAWLGEEVISHDLQLDERWAAFRHLVGPLGLRHCWSFPVVRSDGSVLGTFGVYGQRPRSPSPDDRRFLRDAAKLAGIAIERRLTHDRLTYDATHDALTGLTNRATAIDLLERALVRHAEHRTPVTVLFIDLDRLKVVNDSLGHDTGDHVIREAARRLRGCAAPQDIVARLGGEEFVVVAAGDDGAAVALARRALAALRAPLPGLPGSEELAVTGSIGITVVSDPGVDARQALRRADTAMFVAKGRGGNQYAVHGSADVDAPTRRLELEGSLRHAVEREQLSLVYQPVRRFASGRAVAVEALVRWVHPELGEVGPAEFIPIAEQCGLIHDIGAWVLHTACAAHPLLTAKHGDEVLLAINVSAQQLRDPTLPALVAGAMAANGLGGDRLMVDVTETALLASDETTVQTVVALDAMGVRIALDDFGTGYSSLAVLKRHPVSTIKIDGSFIAGLPDDPDDLALVTAVIGMAHALGISVVAEGIETRRQYETLRDLGCHFAQGYLLGSPAPLAPSRSITRPRVEIAG